jgi:hypothetical protein
MMHALQCIDVGGVIGQVVALRWQRSQNVHKGKGVTACLAVWCCYYFYKGMTVWQHPLMSAMQHM